MLGGGGKGVLLFTADAILLDNVLGSDTHVVIVESIPQAIVHHGVDHAPVTHALAVAAVGQHVGGLAHAFLAAGNHHFSVATLDALHGHMNCLQAGATHLVDGDGRYRTGQAGVDGRLAGRVLPATGGENLAENDLTHLLAGDAGFFHQGLDNGSTELVSTQAGQAATKTADCGTFCGNDHDITHGKSPL